MSLNVTHENIASEDPAIPEITDEELLARAALFQHIYRDEAGVWRDVETPKTMQYLRKTSCIWDPSFGEPAPWRAGEVRELPFYVSCGYYGFFKPSVAEVLSQAPVEELTRDGFNAFFIDSHVGILKSGGYQLARAKFVRLIPRHADPEPNGLPLGSTVDLGPATALLDTEENS